ncbi:MAG: transporter substrate-binding domain-containing protein [Boseongicola sp.]|nr:transporter substrate-binding domain-containing protein [Boseongicola sp.]NNJ67109.1 transporter substrate-binding domain-containing protein [Boseongicola sp.]
MLGILRQRFHAFCLLVLCVSTAPNPATTQVRCGSEGCDDQNVSTGDTVRIGYTQFAPYSGTSNVGVAEGYSIDMFRLLLEPLGYKIQFVPYQNPAELLASLEAGDIDVTTPLSFNSERRAYGTFTDAVHTFSFGVFVVRGGDEIAETKDLIGLKVGASEGSQADRLLRNIEGTTVVPLESGNDLLIPLLSGDVDAVAAPVATLKFNARRAGLSGRIEQSQFSLRQTEAGFLVDRLQTGLVEDMNFAIGYAQSRGHIQELYDEWFRPTADPLTNRESVAVGLAATAVLMALIYWGWLHYGVRKRAQLATQRANSLQEVLNATGETLLIADSEMRPLWWNDAFERNYPLQMPLLTGGKTLKEVFASKQETGAADLLLGSEDFQKSPEEQIADLRAGREAISVDLVAGGRVLKSRSVKLPSGQYGIVATDVTALSVAHTKLQSNAERLQEANRNLSEFSHVAAHDLAGPLRNIRNLHKWILEDIAETDLKLEGEMLENFEHIDRLIERQSVLIEDLLAYSASDDQSLSRAFDPATRWPSILDLCDIPKSFKVTVPGGIPTLFADPVGFDIVIRNLVSNAAKHHDRDSGEISISYQMESDNVRICVTDNGPGIDSAYISKIFQPFKTLRSRDRGGGTGLGLAFVERTVEKWGGQVSVSSNQSERVTTFGFTVPLAGGKTASENVVRLRAS